MTKPGEKSYFVKCPECGCRGVKIDTFTYRCGKVTGYEFRIQPVIDEKTGKAKLRLNINGNIEEVAEVTDEWGEHG